MAGFDHWLYAAQAAAALLEPFFAPVGLAVPLPGSSSAGCTAEEALGWFMTEGGALLASVSLAADGGLAGHAWRLAWALSTFLLRCGWWGEQAGVCRAGRGCPPGRRCGRGGPRASAAGARLCQVGPLRRRQSPRCGGRCGCWRVRRGSQVTGYSGLIWIAERQERYGDMLAISLRALGLSRAVGDRTLEVMSLNDAGYSHALLGNVVVGDAREQVGDHVEPGPALVVALDDQPRRLGDVGVHEHLVLGAGVVLPAPRATPGPSARASTAASGPPAAGGTGAPAPRR